VSDSLPLAGFRIGVTAARKVDEQVALLERRGATVEWAPALSLEPNHVDDDQLRAATEEVLSAPVDMFLATTGVGMRAWFDAAERWGMLPALLAALGSAEILARGPKSVGALRGRGLRELWAPESECFEDVLEHLRGRSLAGCGSSCRSTASRCRWSRTRCAGRAPTSRRSPSTAWRPRTTPSRCSR